LCEERRKIGYDGSGILEEIGNVFWKKIGSWILEGLGIEFWKNFRSRIWEMLTGENFILGIVY